MKVSRIIDTKELLRLNQNICTYLLLTLDQNVCTGYTWHISSLCRSLRLEQNF